MNTKLSFLNSIAVGILCLSITFVACNREGLNDVVNYTGQVVYLKTTTPFPNLMVKVTDGQNIHCQGYTDDAGMFKLKVKIAEIDGSYDLLVGDSTCIPKRVHLIGFGQAEVDLGVIEVEGPAVPVVVTHKVSSVTADAAICGGEVTSGGRLNVTARGVCYGTEAYPEVSGLHTKDGEGLGEFTSTLKDLEYNTIYYARAYATNSIGTSYGEQIKFTTEEGVPIVVTDSVFRITANSARCKGHVESDGGYQVTKRGTCWSTYPDPTIDDECTDNGSGLGEFSSNLTNLQKDTKYYVRTFATNSTATVYGEQLTFTTLDGLATVNTNQATSTATTITVACDVVSDGGFVVTERGVCYSAMNSEPSELDNKIEYGRGKGSYNVSITDLNIVTTYYVRAYAINENGTAYGDVLQVATKDGLATVEISGPKDVTALTAACEVSVTDAGGATLQNCGICWSTSANPTTSNNTALGGMQLNTIYNCKLTELTPNTTYYVRAYATTNISTAYGEELSFTTTKGTPEISLSAPTNILTKSFVANAKITSDGGYSVTTRGICYSNTNSSPTLEDSHVDAGTGTGSFSQIISNLEANTTYYIRAYATNSIGSVYSDALMLQTGSGLQGVHFDANPVTNIKAGSALCNVVVDYKYSDAQIISEGCCWSSTITTPTTDDALTNDGQSTSTFTSSLINLSPVTTYYVRAYVTTAYGTSYSSNYVTFTTNNGLPTVTTSGITTANVTSSSFICGGDVIDEGDAIVTEKGLCWNTTGTPTLSDSHSSDGFGTGSFTHTITGVSPHTQTYYVRAYATNIYGTVYGEVVEQNKKNPYHLPIYENYMIYPQDLGEMNWPSANSACENLNAYSFDDWRLPTEGEAKLFCRYCKTIFTQGANYWTSTKDYQTQEYNYSQNCYERYTYVLIYDLYSNTVGYSTWNTQHTVRPIRIVTQ